MMINELGTKLGEVYVNAVRGQKVTKVLLFGIRYSEELKNHSMREIVDKAGIPSNYATELLKAVKLAQYVDLKNE